ncbi:glycosyltransferase family 31 protein [Aspergillus lucknowensis]|uniref:Glycosyltransferase family 31 protein n=1 Tax=Aspergillus lucknowensis TaxID=176173 RepID=A0ABR4LQ28_9EURO
MQQFYLLFHTLQQHKLASWKLLVLAAGLILGCVVLFTYSSTSTVRSDRPSPDLSPSETSSNADSDATNKADSSANACYIDLNLLRLYADNASSVEYARLNFGVLRTENFTAFSDSLDVSIPSNRIVHLDTSASREIQTENDCTASVTIEVPLISPRPDASHMVFGVATSLEKLEDSLDAFSHWAGNTNAQIIAVVEQGGSSIRRRIQQRAKDLGIRLTITQTEDDRLDRYFSLIQVLYQHRHESTQWAVLIDDDTFFPSMKNLVDKLASYDSSIPQYVGAMTEDLARLSGTGYMAYGGAGIFLSLPLLSSLQYVFETCHAFKERGDRMLASCIYAHTDAKFTWERGLYQLDLHGDLSGFFESGRPLPLSVHHWRSWFQADMVALGKVSAVCGDECLLRRFQLSKDWFLVNGYSVIQDRTLWNDPRPMEQTWDKSKYKGSDPFAYSLGPLRRADPDKVSLRLRGVVEDEDSGSIRQVYVLSGADEKPPRVLEVVWAVVEED